MKQPDLTAASRLTGGTETLRPLSEAEFGRLRWLLSLLSAVLTATLVIALELYA